MYKRQLELRSAQVTLASARRNEYVAQAQLLAAMGRLGGPNLARCRKAIHFRHSPIQQHHAVRTVRETALQLSLIHI